MSAIPLLPPGFSLFFDEDEGRWILDHLDPKHGDHGCRFGPFLTETEAIACAWREANEAHRLRRLRP